MNRCNQSGMSLIAVIIAMGLFSLLLTAMSSAMTTNFRMQRSLELRAERQAIVNMLLRAVSCEVSLPQQCKPGVLLSVYSRVNGRTLVDSQDVKTIGSWALRAQCAADGASIEVAGVLLKPTGKLTSTSISDFYFDPLTQQRYGWDHPNSLLFPAGAGLCYLGADAKNSQNCHEQQNSDGVNCASESNR